VSAARLLGNVGGHLANIEPQTARPLRTPVRNPVAVSDSDSQG